MATPTGKPPELPPPSEQADEPRPAPKMVEPERIPSMREQPERWVPEGAVTDDSSSYEQPFAEEPFEEPAFEPMQLAEVEPVEPAASPSAAASEVPREPEAPPVPEPEAAPEPEPAREPDPEPEPEPEPEPQPEPDSEPEPQAPSLKWPTTVKETFARMDAGWSSFRAAAAAWPSERMDERMEEDGWSRKQMLAHITAWHDSTHDRLGKMILSGQPEDGVPDADAFNARIARQAIGRTAGEILKEMEMTYNRLRRQVSRMTDQQLRADDGWAAQVIAGNTYEHYEEHAPDVYQPPVDPNARRR